MNYYSIYKSSEFKTIHLRKLSDKLDAFSNIQKKNGNSILLRVIRGQKKPNANGDFKKGKYSQKRGNKI